MKSVRTKNKPLVNEQKKKVQVIYARDIDLMMMKQIDNFLLGFFVHDKEFCNPISV